MHSKTLPAGCDQQGRHNTRRERWIEQEWRETIHAPRNEPKFERVEQEPPLTRGCALIAAAIVATIAGFVAYGPWL